MQEISLASLAQPNTLFITEYQDHTLFEYYLVGNITGAENYTDLCHTLRKAEPQDKFIIRINSGGGQVYSGNQIINAIQECEATVVGYIEGICGSMTTFIFLACDDWVVSDLGEFFAHTSSSGAWGKEHETYEASQFFRKQTYKTIRDGYQVFFSEEEIDKILAGSDIYLDAGEVRERLEILAEHRKELEFEEEASPSPIETMISSSVAIAIEEVLAKLGLGDKEVAQKEETVMILPHRVCLDNQEGFQNELLDITSKQYEAGLALAKFHNAEDVV